LRIIILNYICVVKQIDMIKDIEFTELDRIIEPMEWLYDGDDHIVLED